MTITHYELDARSSRCWKWSSNLSPGLGCTCIADRVTPLPALSIFGFHHSVPGFSSDVAFANFSSPRFFSPRRAVSPRALSSLNAASPRALSFSTAATARRCSSAIEPSSRRTRSSSRAIWSVLDMRLVVAITNGGSLATGVLALVNG